MRTLSQFLPAKNDRALLVGMTGSGKTELARRLLASRPFVVVLDPKRRFTADGYVTLGKLSEVTKSKEPRIIYRPSFDVLHDWQDASGDIARFFEWIFKRGNTTLYVDEAYLVTQGDILPRYYHACLTQGRELGIETWTATQRPMRIPQVLLSEAEHSFVFRLQLPQDRARVEAVSGVSRETIRTLQKFEFFYCPSDDSPVGPLMLSLPSLSLSA